MEGNRIKNGEPCLLSVEDIIKKWGIYLTEVKKSSSATFPLLAKSNVKKYDNGVLYLEVPFVFYKTIIETSDKVEMLSKIFTKIYGYPCKNIECIFNEDILPPEGVLYTENEPEDNVLPDYEESRLEEDVLSDFGDDKQEEGINEELEKALQVLDGGEDNSRSKSLFKQSREVLESTAYSTGKEKRSDKSLLPTDKREHTLPKYIPFIDFVIAEWQNNTSYLDDNGFLHINNLSKFARDFSKATGKTITPQRIKDYLYMSRIPFPYITKEEKRDVLEYKPLFEVKVYLDKEDSQGGFIPIEEYNRRKKNSAYRLVIIRPTEVYCNSIGKDIYGKDLPEETKKLKEGRGNTFLSKDTISFEDKLSFYALKLFRYTASNTPTSRISFKKLVKNLNLEQERRDKGYKGIKRDIDLAFKELKEKGHFKVWKYNNDKGEYDGFYSWTYTDEYVKHQNFAKKRRIEEEEEKRTLDEKKQAVFLSKAWGSIIKGKRFD